MVIAVDRGRYTCVIENHENSRKNKKNCTLTSINAVRARELGRRGVVVGDWVGLVGDTSGQNNSLARIVRIADRQSALTRTADDTNTTGGGRGERVIVANADQLVIVSSLADPPPRPGFIDRCLVAAYDTNITPILCLTKSDLAGPQQILDYYAELNLSHVLCHPEQPLTDICAALEGHISVLIGHSGVGKSTLVNRLVPTATRAVGEVSAIGKGRHTSTSVVALALPSTTESQPFRGWIIDTPGIRSFGLAHVSPESLLHGFPDLVESSTQCPPHCDHTGQSGDSTQSSSWSCGLDQLIASGGADPRRLASYRRLLASRAGDSPEEEKHSI